MLQETVKFAASIEASTSLRSCGKYEEIKEVSRDAFWRSRLLSIRKWAQAVDETLLIVVYNVADHVNKTASVPACVLSLQVPPEVRVCEVLVDAPAGLREGLRVWLGGASVRCSSMPCRSTSGVARLSRNVPAGTALYVWSATDPKGDQERCYPWEVPEVSFRPVGGDPLVVYLAGRSRRFWTEFFPGTSSLVPSW